MDKSLPVACDLTGLRPAERELRARLAQSLAEAVRTIRDLPDGCEITIDSQVEVARQLPRLLELEGRCCPFLSCEVSSEGGMTRIRLSGPPGTRELLKSQFGFALP